MRQHATPIYVPPSAGTPTVALRPVSLDGERILEDHIQTLVHEHPTVLPIREIDPAFDGAISVCRELATPAGPIDNFLVTPSGFPVLVECKLWRNAEARREVVGQILDYAKELVRYTSSDIQREVSKSTRGGPDALMEIVRAAAPSTNEIDFHDNLSANLRRGRFLLLLVGDGIRERVEAIAEYIEEHAGLHFTLGLVELAIFGSPDGGRLVIPRTLAHTRLITRRVVEVPQGFYVEEASDGSDEPSPDPDAQARGDALQAFWEEFLKRLTPILDDREQPIPKPPRQGMMYFMLPAPGGSSWITVYREKKDEVGIFISSNRDTAGEHAIRTISEDWENVGPLLGGASRKYEKNGRPRIGESATFGLLDAPDVRERAFAWLAERVNTYINVLRPRVRSAAADFQG